MTWNSGGLLGAKHDTYIPVDYLLINPFLGTEIHSPLPCHFRYSSSGLRSRSRSWSRSQSESVVFLGVGVGVGIDKIYRLRPTPGKLLFPIQTNRHTDYLKHFSAHIYVVDWLDDMYRTRGVADGGSRGGGPDPRTFENRKVRPPRFENEVAKIRCFSIFRVFWGRLAILPTIRSPPPHSKIRGDAPVQNCAALHSRHGNRSKFRT